MSSNWFCSLPWLPECPEDFNRRCRAALETPEIFGSSIRQLAGYGLDGNQSIRLAKTIQQGRDKGYSLAPLTPYRLGVIGNSTTDFIVPALVAAGARWGIALECTAAGFDQGLQESLAADSALNLAGNDAVLLALDWRGLPLRSTPGDSEAAQRTVEGALDFIDAMRAGIRRNSGARCLVQNFAPPAERVFGSFERRLEGTLQNLVERVNAGLLERLKGSSDLLVDTAGLAESVGLWNWYSPGQWNLAKLPFEQVLTPLYADHVLRVVAAGRGLSRRCLILDLDNTLWGGVIGDDGLNGIKIGQGDAAGEGYLNFQQYILALRERGIVLAVSSKNEDGTARLPFREHADMLLREEHLAVFQANWNDKATNIEAIASTLALGLESLVFVDDNPFERNQVREALPGVAVPEMPPDPADYARVLSMAGYFESVTFSEEDVQRAAYYAGNARRAEMEQKAVDLTGYLTSLGMEITFQPFTESGRTRIAQLINKSNQFNLTTQRYTEADLQRFEADTEMLTLQVRLRDKLGDNGMISVIVCRAAGLDIWEIDTWLMSCRVLGRRVQEMVLLEVAAQARERGIRKLRGKYIPSGRNKLVETHYAGLGFTLVERREDGATIWEADVPAIAMTPPPMVVKRIGFEKAELQPSQ